MTVVAKVVELLAVAALECGRFYECVGGGFINMVVVALIVAAVVEAAALIAVVVAVAGALISGADGGFMYCSGGINCGASGGIAHLTLATIQVVGDLFVVVMTVVDG